MKIDFQQTLMGLGDEPLMEGDKPATLGTVSIAALLNAIPGPNGQPEELSGEAKVRQAVLAQNIFKATGPLDVSVDDVHLLKQRIGRMFTPLAVMRAWNLLDPAPE